jgi:hypothetical protein
MTDVDGLLKTANDRQVGGEHYATKKIQPWDFIVENGLGFLDGNVVKYVCRYRDKGGVQDLEKARHYLDKLIEVEREARGLTRPMTQCDGNHAFPRCSDEQCWRR